MAAAQVSNEAFVTLSTNNSYALGALTLGYSLRRVGTTRRLVCMVTKDVSASLKEELAKVFGLVQVNILDSQDHVNLALLTRHDLGVTFTKLHCWRLTQFTKCVFLDADTLVLQNIDDLFERDELSAAADVGWPDCFNSGVFVYKPSDETYAALLQLAVTTGSFDGGDQGLLNLYFRDWATKDIKHHLPFLYNVVAQSFYTYLPAFKRFGKDAKVLHFIGAYKPWRAQYHPESGSVDCPGELGLFCQDFLKLWWEIFTQNVHLNKDDLSKLGVSHHEHHGSHGYGDGHSGSFSKELLDDQGRQQSWEKGDIDYMGIDSFRFIQKQLDTKTGKPGNSGHHDEAGNRGGVPSFPKPSLAIRAVPTTLPVESARSQEHSQPEKHESHETKVLEQPRKAVPVHEVGSISPVKPMESAEKPVVVSPVEKPTVATHLEKPAVVTPVERPAPVTPTISSPTGSRSIHAGAAGISVKSVASAHHHQPQKQQGGQPGQHHQPSVKIVTKGRGK